MKTKFTPSVPYCRKFVKDCPVAELLVRHCLPTYVTSIAFKVCPELFWICTSMKRLVPLGDAADVEPVPSERSKRDEPSPMPQLNPAIAPEGATPPPLNVTLLIR